MLSIVFPLLTTVYAPKALSFYVDVVLQLDIGYQFCKVNLHVGRVYSQPWLSLCGIAEKGCHLWVLLMCSFLFIVLFP